MVRGIFIFIIVLGGLFYFTPVVNAVDIDHLVISEVQITGGAGKTTNDFVEIYNPTVAAIDLNGIRLVKRTAAGTSDTTLKSWIETTLVPAHGYYLWANSDFSTMGTTPDIKTTGTIADNNGIALRQGPENTGVIIDTVAWGTASNVFVEGVVFSPNPGVGQSIERKPGGAEGNGLDTNNNVSDFSLQTNPNPQNSLSTPVPALPPPPPPPVVEPPPPPPPPVVEDPPPVIPAVSENNNVYVPKIGDILINEFVADPTDSIEWVELYNKTTQKIDLTAWKLFDGTGVSVKTLSGEISASDFLVFELSSARLNNSGDFIKLQMSDSVVIDEVSYGIWNDGTLTDNAPATTKAGQSIARKSNGLDTSADNNDFAVSDTPTKGASNIITVNTVTTVGGNSAPQVIVNEFVPKIVINEFVADPEDGPEWIELYNSGMYSVDLSDWWIEDGSEAKTKLSGMSVPEHFLVIIDIAGNLNNKGDIIRLKNSKGEVVDKVSYGVWEDGTPSDNAPCATDPYSVARVQDGQDTDIDKTDFIITATVTKGKANIIKATESTSATSSSIVVAPVTPAKAQVATKTTEEKKIVPIVFPDVTGKLFVSEIIPDPEGSDNEEWVEIFWAGETALNLQGFSLDDEEGGSRAFALDGLTIQPKSFLIVLRAQSKLALNNDEDSVRLFTPDAKIIDEISYEGSASGRSYARRDDGKWLWTTPTKGVSNSFDETSTEESKKSTADQDGEFKELEIATLLNEENGARVRVSGALSALPGILGTQIFYLSSGSGGIQVYMYKKDFPKMNLGDLVSVQGVMAETQGEQRIKISSKEDIQVLKHGSPVIPQEILDLDAGGLDENLAGALIVVRGTVLEIASNKLLLGTEQNEIPVMLTKGAAIDTQDFSSGLEVAVVGIARPTKTGMGLFPRGQEDLEIIGAGSFGGEQISPTQKTATPYGKTTAYASGGVMLAGLAIRRRRILFSAARASVFVARKIFSKTGRV